MRRLIAVPLAACAVLAACGNETKVPDDEQVRLAVAGFGDAVQRKDYDALCGRYLATRLVGQLREVGLPCEVALQQGLENVRSPELEIGKVRVTGDRAAVDVRSAAVGQPTSLDVVTLVREEGGWRVDDLGGVGPPSPPKPKVP